MLNIERRNNLITFNNEHGISYGYLVEGPDGYRMAWYAGIVMSHQDLRDLAREITNFVNRVTINII